MHGYVVYLMNPYVENFNSPKSGYSFILCKINKKGLEIIILSSSLEIIILSSSLEIESPMIDWIKLTDYYHRELFSFKSLKEKYWIRLSEPNVEIHYLHS